MTGFAGLFVWLLAVSFLIPSTAPVRAASPLYFGAFPGPRNGQTAQEATQALEAAIGRPLDVVRDYELWDSPFPTSDETWLRDTGHILALSVKAKRLNGTRVRWIDIANAQPGSTLHANVVSWATRVRDFGGPVWFIFNHEAEEASNDGSGSASDFIAAWRKIITTFRQQGVTNAKYVWVATSYSFWRTDGRRADLWYPGDDYVDAIAADPYNWYQCRPGINNPWWSLQTIIDPLRLFGQAHSDKELMLMEFGSYEDLAVPGRKAQWFNDVQQLFKQPGWEQFSAILYYNTEGKGTYANCRWWIDTSQSSLDAFRLFANDPFYGGQGQPPTAIFTDDFDQGFANWTGATGLTIDVTIGDPAGPSARAQATAGRAWAYRSLGATYQAVCLSIHVRLASIGANAVDLFRLRTASDGPIARVFVAANRRLSIRSDYSGTQFASAASLPLSTWSTVELCGSVATSSSWTLYLNGTTVAGPWTTDTGATPVGRIQIGDNALKTFSANFDRVVLDVSPG